MRFEILGQNSEVVQIVETSANPIRIGKVTNGNEVVLDNASVGRKHAKLEISSSGIKLSAEDVSKPTLVNGQKVAPFKPVMVETGAVMTFGQVQVRLVKETSHALEASDEQSSTLAMATLAATIPASVPPAVPKLPKPPVLNSASRQNSPFNQTAPATPQPKIIKKLKRPVSFERRFLSARGKTGSCVLEIAMIWQDTVLSIQQFKAQDGAQITVGIEDTCNYRVDLSAPSKCILTCDDGQWQLIFNNADDGFVLDGDKKTAFNEASNTHFQAPSYGATPGSLACPLSPSIRAKFTFGDVHILVHYVDEIPVAFPLLHNVPASSFAGLVASILIHFALFSVILFASDRVDALMIDRILTNSRFASVVTPPENEPIVEKPDEEPPLDTEQPDEVSDIANETPSLPFPANAPADSTSTSHGMSKSEAVAAAKSVGLLNQATAMNSMLAAALDVQNLANLDWCQFDPTAVATTSSYGLTTTGTKGGPVGLGIFNNTGIGPGAPGTRAIRTASSHYEATLGTKCTNCGPHVIPRQPVVVAGSLDKRIIQKVVRQHSGELRACYEKELFKIKGLSGRIVLVWIISPQGAVTKALVKESTIKNKNVEQCVLNSVKYWRFPVPKGGSLVQIEYPFVFDVGK